MYIVIAIFIVFLAHVNLMTLTAVVIAKWQQTGVKTRTLLSKFACWIEGM